MASRLGQIPLSAVLVCALPIAAASEDVTVISIHAHGPDDSGLPQQALDDLEAHFKLGHLEQARTAAVRIVDRVAGATPFPEYDHKKNVLAVHWIGSDAKGDPVLRRLLLPEASASPYSLDLPGLQPGSQPPRLYEVLLTLDKRSTLTSQYTFTRQDDPVLAQIPSAVEKFIGPLFGFAGAVAGTPGGRSLPELVPGKTFVPPTVWATSSSVSMPFERASIKVKQFARVPITRAEWESEVSKLQTSLQFTLVPRSDSARSCALLYEKDAIAVASHADCRGDSSSPEKCLQAFDRAFTSTYLGCVPAKPSEADLKAVQTVDDKFRTLVVSGQAAKFEGSAEFRNSPRTHFSFGLGTALIVGASLDEERAKLNDAGILVRDPLPRPLTMVMLHWSPAGYDADSPKIQRNERYRFFTAGVLTPDVGVAGGVSVLAVRGLGLNAGFGVLFGKTLNEGDEFDKAPADSTNAFRVGKEWILFAGINVGLK